MAKLGRIGVARTIALVLPRGRERRWAVPKVASRIGRDIRIEFAIASITLGLFTSRMGVLLVADATKCVI